MTVPSERLDVAGAALWASLNSPTPLAGPAAALALEAARCADRCDRLDAILTGGEEWFDLVEKPESSGMFQVTVNAPLAEARQQQGRLDALLAAVRAAGAAQPREDSGDAVDDLARARAVRLAAAAGTDPA